MSHEITPFLVQIPQEQLDDLHDRLRRTRWPEAEMYWESFREPLLGPVSVPTGCSIFPRGIFRPSRRWPEKQFTDIRYWNELDKGGHFAAFEQPDQFVQEVRAAFRSFRS
jgi:epoxide hydrolase